MRRESRGQGRRRVIVGTGAALGAGALLTPAAEAATFTVVNLANAGYGSLREAVEDANEAPGDDVVVFNSGLSGTIELSGAGAAIEIRSDGLEIRGPGADTITVDGDGLDRIFYASDFDAGGERVSISGLTLTGGRAPGDGGAVASGAGGAEAAELTVRASVLAGNSALGSGGAVAIQEGSAVIRNSLISGNSAEEHGGGLQADGALGDVVIEGSLLAGNSAGDHGGGAQLDHARSVTISAATITGNEAGGYGGGATLYDTGGPVLVDATTIAVNRSGSVGGGLAIWGQDGPVAVQSSTISGNVAAVAGGGVYSDNTRDTKRAFRNSTVAGNAASEGGGISARLADDGPPGGEVLELRSTIVADNFGGQAPDLGDADDVPAEDLGVFSLGFSLVESPGGVPAIESPPGSNVLGADPHLGPLESNGGPTQTHLPGRSSPALDAGVANGLDTDQRGVARTFDLPLIAGPPGGDGTDIGSVELNDFETANCQGESLPSLVGTDGDDALAGTGGPDVIFGLGGDDLLSGLGGDDCLQGGAGDDVLTGGGGRDQLKGRAGSDRLRGQNGRDRLRGQGGRDRLAGGGGRDRLAGGAGEDRLKGGTGKDVLKGNSAADELKAADGTRDRVNCGGGRDKAIVDPKDKVSRSCEQVVGAG